MKHRFQRLARALSPEHDMDRVHFHADASGRPFVCENAFCVSPGLDVRPRLKAAPAPVVGMGAAHRIHG